MRDAYGCSPSLTAFCGPRSLPDTTQKENQTVPSPGDLLRRHLGHGAERGARAGHVLFFDGGSVGGDPARDRASH
jgi:hypothetical protein